MTSLAKSKAIAFPMLRLALVTITFFPVNLIIYPFDMPSNDLLGHRLSSFHYPKRERKFLVIGRCFSKGFPACHFPISVVNGILTVNGPSANPPTA